MKIVLYENVIFRAKKRSSHDELLVESVVDSQLQQVARHTLVLI